MSGLTHKVLVDKICRGKSVDDLVSHTRKNSYLFFELHKTTGIRNPIVRYHITLDDRFLVTVFKQIWTSPNAGKRLGFGWLPSDTASVKLKEEEDDHWTSTTELKIMNDVCTKFCTRKYFPDALSRVNMIANVIRLYDRLAALTDARFNVVFKGGVMIRLVLLEFLQNLPLDNRQTVVDYMKKCKALGMSDLDFEIVPDEHDSPAYTVHRYLLLGYAVLLWLQQCMENEVHASSKDATHEGLLNLNWDENEAKHELKAHLQSAVDEIEDAKHSLFRARIDHVFLSDDVQTPPRGYLTKGGKSKPARRNNALIFDCVSEDTGKKTKCVCPALSAFRGLGVRNVPTESGGSRFYATLNTYIGEDAEKSREDHLTGVFHLSRIKHAFVVYYTTRTGHKRCDRLGGEMVDMSQSHGTTRDLLRKSLYDTCERPYTLYPLLGVDRKDVVLKSYTAEGFMVDHKTMVHNTETEPWEANKLEKRLLRYVAFFIAHTLGPYTNGRHVQKMHALHRLVNTTRSLDALSRPLTTGVDTVDTFAETERRSLSKLPSAKARQAATKYLKTLHTHLSTLVTAFDGSVPFETFTHHIDESHMQTARHHVRITATTEEFVKRCYNR